jgi:hypothetical protein
LEVVPKLSVVGGECTNTNRKRDSSNVTPCL